MPQQHFNSKRCNNYHITFLFLSSTFFFFSIIFSLHLHLESKNGFFHRFRSCYSTLSRRWVGMVLIFFYIYFSADPSRCWQKPFRCSLGTTNRENFILEVRNAQNCPQNETQLQDVTIWIFWSSAVLKTPFYSSMKTKLI